MGWGEAEPRRGGRRREPFPLRAAAAGGARWFRFPGAAAGPSRQLPRSVAGGGGGGGGASPEAMAGPATARGRGRGGGGRPAASAACLGLVPAPSSPSSVPEHVGRSQLVRPVRTAIVTGRGGGVSQRLVAVCPQLSSGGGVAFAGVGVAKLSTSGRLSCCRAELQRSARPAPPSRAWDCVAGASPGPLRPGGSRRPGPGPRPRQSPLPPRRAGSAESSAGARLVAGLRGPAGLRLGSGSSLCGPGQGVSVTGRSVLGWRLPEGGWLKNAGVGRRNFGGRNFLPRR